MQLTHISNMLKPITLSAGIAAAMPSYSAIDSHSGIYSTITDTAMFESVKRTDWNDLMFYAQKLRFQTLYEKWRNDTRFYSSISDLVNHDAFKNIITMDKDAVPFIIEEINREPSTLVWALNFIFHKKISNNPDTTIPEACKLWVKELSR